MANFSFKNILWKETLWVNFLRSVVAGIIWMITVFIFSTGQHSPGMPNPLLIPIIWPVGYFLFFLPLGIVAGWLGRIGVPFTGLLTFIPAMLIIPADPVMFIVNKVNPQIIPIQDCKLINLALSIWIYRN